MEQNMVMADAVPTVPARPVVAMEPDRAAVANYNEPYIECGKHLPMLSWINTST